jgi:uncharacterized membrane protein YedE/YeeE
MDETVNLWLAGGGLVLGLAFGAIVQRSRFCMMAALSNLVLMRDFRQFHAYLAAVAVAVLGTQWLDSAGLVAICETSYRAARIDWAGLMLGGLTFGVGSTLAGGCAGRTLVSAAEGNLAAWLALLAFGLAAAMTQFGAFEPLRMWLFRATAAEIGKGDGSLASVLALRPWELAAGLSLASPACIALTGRRTRSLGLLAAGALIGALVVGGWWVTGYLAQDDFNHARPASLTFSGPLARATLYLTTANRTGHDFDLALIVGVLLGASGSALLGRTLRWVAPEPAHIRQYLLGGTLMGIGATLAGGCNIGQGLSGVSTLSVGSFIAVAAIFAGMRLGLAWLQRHEGQQAMEPAVQIRT